MVTIIKDWCSNCGGAGHGPDCACGTDPVNFVMGCCVVCGGEGMVTLKPGESPKERAEVAKDVKRWQHDTEFVAWMQKMEYVRTVPNKEGKFESLLTDGTTLYMWEAWRAAKDNIWDMARRAVQASAQALKDGDPNRDFGNETPIFKDGGES